MSGTNTPSAPAPPPGYARRLRGGAAAHLPAHPGDLGVRRVTGKPEQLRDPVLGACVSSDTGFATTVCQGRDLRTPAPDAVLRQPRLCRRAATGRLTVFATAPGHDEPQLLLRAKLAGASTASTVNQRRPPGRGAMFRPPFRQRRAGGRPPPQYRRTRQASTQPPCSGRGEQVADCCSGCRALPPRLAVHHADSVPTCQYGLLELASSPPRTQQQASTTCRRPAGLCPLGAGADPAPPSFPRPAGRTDRHTHHLTATGRLGP